ncbi:MAG: alpha/beta hydrolase [Proteobacteria bacterium]|nr:alpha/beta hydrolase [Pseudomonadota bacterium]
MRIPALRPAGAVLALLATVSGCQRHGTAPAAATSGAPASATPAMAGAPDAAAVTSGPRITLSADNVHIEYHVTGAGEPAIVLIHGWASDSAYWNAQLGILRPLYTVVTLDLAGHGASGANRNDWSIARYAQDVAAVVRQLSNRRIVLVGHAMGATVALAAAPLVGERLRGIIAVDALRSIGQPPPAAAEVRQRVAPFESDFVGSTRKLVRESLFRRDADNTLVQKVAYDMSLEPPAVAIPSLTALLSTDLAPVLAAVHVPVYAINSDLAPTDAVRIRKALPGFRLDVLEHTGHFLMMEAPDRFNPLLLKDIQALAERQRGQG